MRWISAGRDLSDVPVSRGRPLLFDDDRATGDVTARCKDLDLAAGRPRGAVPGAPAPLAAWMAEPGVWTQARG
jgi:hypothetical protein